MKLKISTLLIDEGYLLSTHNSQLIIELDFKQF